MRRRHLPKRWLMTDERQGDAVWSALARMPRGGGVVFRHYATADAERCAMFARVVRIARRRRLTIIRAGAQALPHEDGTHNRREHGRGLRTFAVHDPRQLVAARRARADLVFVSPVFTTRSHTEARALGAVRLGLLIRNAKVPVVALGGMNASTSRRLRGLKLHGWAGIDGWARTAAAKPRRQP